MRVVRFVVNIS